MSDAVIDGKEIDDLKQYFKDMNIEFKKREEDTIEQQFTLLDGF